MAYSRGASALGVAIALQEVDVKRVTDSIICSDWSLYSSVASASSGIELMNNEIIVMGNSNRSSSGEYIIGHDIMKDPLDSAAVIEALKTTGLHLGDGTTTISSEDRQKLVNVFAKAGGGNGIVRGRRTTMLTDSDISSTRHARAVVNAVIASIVGDPMIYVSVDLNIKGPWAKDLLQ